MSISSTWGSYALIVTICLGIYYSVVGFLFYRGVIKLAISAKEDNDTRYESAYQNTSADTENKDLFGEPVLSHNNVNIEQSNLNPEAQDFADEMVAFTSSCDKTITKESLIQSIKRIIRKYPSLSDGEYKYELNQLIAISTENYCSIHVSADELSELWKK